jgi:hypothetical protein
MNPNRRFQLKGPFANGVLLIGLVLSDASPAGALNALRSRP